MQLYQKATLFQVIAETTDGGDIGTLVVQGKIREAAKGNPARHGFSRFYIAQVLPALKQKIFEHTHGGIGWIVHNVPM
jgi:hypothetical protein